MAENDDLFNEAIGSLNQPSQGANPAGDDPLFADAIAGLPAPEKKVGIPEKVVRATSAGLGSISEGVWGVVETGAGIGSEFITKPLDYGLKAIGADPNSDADLFGGIQKFAGEMRQGIKRSNEQQIEPVMKDAGLIERGIYSGIQSVGANVPGMAVSVLTGNPVPALASMGLVSGGVSAGEAMDQGLPPSQALNYGLSQGGVEVVTEKIPMGRLLGDLKAGSGFLKTLGHQMLTEVPTEQVATIWQNFNEWAYLNPDQPFSEYLRKLPEDMATTLVSTMVATGVQTGALQGLDRVVNGKREPAPPIDAQQPPPPRTPTRDDLEAAMQQPEVQTPPATPETAPVSPTVAPAADNAAPVPQTANTTGTAPTQQGFKPGDVVEHVNGFGEVIKGTIDSIQNTELGQTIQVIDANGQINTIFEGDGTTSIVLPPSTRDQLEAAMEGRPVEQPLQEDRGAEITTVAQPETLPPAADQMGPRTFKQSLPDMTEAELMTHYAGKNIRNSRLAGEELERRYPEFGITKSIDIEQAAAAANANPTEGQKEAGNYQKGHVSISGLPISIENAKGSTRSGMDRAGNQWQVQMPAHYGYVKRTVGADGDHVDVYIGDNHQSPNVFVVDQIDPDTQDFDEHKALVGFDNIQQAMGAYESAFSDASAERRVGAVTIMTMDEFKEWLKNEDTKKPLLYKKPENDNEFVAPAQETVDVPFDVSESVPATVPESVPQSEAQPTETEEEKSPVAETVPQTVPVGQQQDGPRQGSVGMKLAAGEVVLTTTGRETTPFPKIDTSSDRKASNTMKRVDQWLMQNALDEAMARGDRYNARMFAANLEKPQQADKDSAESYLFDPDFVFQPPAQDQVFEDKEETQVQAEESAQEEQDGNNSNIGNDYFFSEKIDEAINQSSKSREILIQMTPDDFIKMAEKIKSDDNTKTNTVLSVLKEEGQFKELPFLRFENDGKGGARVTAHEGRHRAMALKELGVSTIPVRFISAESGSGQAIRWGEQSDPQSFDIFVGEWPKKLESQDGGEFIDFPVSDARSSAVKDSKEQTEEKAQSDKVKISDVSINDSRGGEMFGYKELTVNGDVAAAADINLYDGGVYIQNIVTKKEYRRKGYAKKLVDDLFREFPDKDIFASSMTDDGGLFFKSSYNVGENNRITKIEKGRKLQDVGEKMEGKKAFQDRMDKHSVSERAKEIIASTKTKEVFNITKREGQTDGVARFAQAMVDEIYGFSEYLKMNGTLYSSERGRWATKVPGWEEQVKILFSMDAIDSGDVDMGDRVLSERQAHIKRSDIITSAEEYIEFGAQLSRLFAKSDNIEQFKVNIRAELNDSEFNLLFDRFAKSYSLQQDIFSGASWTRFGRITDDDKVKETKRAIPLTRPRLDAIERKGMKDHRNGRDVTPEEFRSTFGFRGVEFGEWVNAKEGQSHVNHAYDALQDLAERLGISPVHISLGGKLGFAFGSRGSGEHAAHYEPGTNVINLTKTKGDGSVAHEWLHALDHNLRSNDHRSVQIMDAAYKTLTKKLDSVEVLEKKIKQFLKGEIWYERNKSAGPIGGARMFIKYIGQDPFSQIGKTTEFKRESDALGKDYWGTGDEMLARSWEAFILDTLQGKSPYLVSDWAGEGVATKEAGYRGTPYPTGEERQSFNQFYEEFLKQIEFSDDGVKFKEGARLPIQDEIRAVIEAAEGFLPKLADMMKEISDGSVYKNQVSAGVSESDGAGSAEDVPGIDEVGQNAPDSSGGRGSGDGAVRSDAEQATEGRDEGRSKADSSGNDVQSDDTVLESDADAIPDFQAVGKNHKIAVGALDEKRGQKEKARDNLKAIELVKKIEIEAREATPDEQILLAKYTGWGSVKNAFPGVDGKPKDGWSDIVNEVKSALTDKEYREARRSIQYAHYTSEIVVRGMWDAMKRFGLKQGTVFEPGMGIGNFIGMKPDTVPVQYSGIEIDTMSARIARILYPESSVRQTDFTAARYADNMFDSAIGNPPFSDTIIRTDPKYRKDNLNIHNYFFVKTIDMVAPGGVIAFVTSRYSLDSLDDSARKKMAESVDLVGAIRLPNTAFKTNAHTEVVTDIIFLRKRLPGEESNGIKWMETKEIDVLGELDAPHRVNEYFANNPEMVLGDYAQGGMYSKTDLTVNPVENADLQDQIREAIERLPENIVTEIQKANTDAIDMMPTEKKEGSYYIKGDTLMQVDNGMGIAIQLRGKGVTGGMTKAQEQKIRALIPVRDALRKTMSSMVERDDKAMKSAQKELKKSYDSFVKKYGPITKSDTESRPATPGQVEEARDEMRADFEAAEEEFNEGDIDLTNLINKVNPETGKKYTSAQIGRIRQERREEIEAAGRTVDEGDFDPASVPDNVTIKYDNLDAFKGDPEYYNLMILENYNEDTGEAALTDVFEKNIIAEVKKPEIKTAVDALNYSLLTRNGVDIDMMAKELGVNPASVVEELEQLDLIYAMPDIEGGGEIYKYSEEYLSGLVKDKLKYAKVIANNDPKYQRNVLALEAVQPKDIPASEINTQLGSPYFKPNIVADFMRQEMNISATIKYTPVINAYEVISHDPGAPENVQQFGIPEKRATDIMESLLMRKDIRVTFMDDEGKRVVDVAKTQAAQDKAKLIQDKFSEWIWKSEHGDKVFRSYNDEYNNIVPRKFDGSHITTAISPTISLRPHQKRAVWRVMQTGNTYLAHAVGAGKTLEMAVSAMEMRRLGQWKKPVIVVPNHMLAQFSGEFRAAYPQAKILVADEQNFHTDRRKRFVANVAKGDWDSIIMTQSSFKKIPISSSYEADITELELDKYRAALTEAGGDAKKRGSRGSTAARLEKQIEKMEAKLKNLRLKDKDDSFTFEELGIDAILLDEAHGYRKLSFPTMQGTMKGVTPIGSKQSWDLYMKTRYLDTIHPGRNLVMASGTPLTNTLAEVYTIQRYMNERALNIRSIQNFDSWSSVYAAAVTNPERQPSGAYKNVTRLAEFRNLRSLSQMVGEFMDTVTSDELGSLVDRPTMKTGTMIIKTVKPTREYQSFQKYLQHRTEQIASTPRNTKGADNILSIIGEGRHAAIDMRLIDPTLTEMDTKLEDMIETVLDVWKRTSNDEFKQKYKGDDRISPIKGGTQLIFSDLGVKPKSKAGKSFSAYDHIKRRLIKAGVPAGQIAFISEYDTTEEKRRLQKMVNNGEIRILIGSTTKMGTGTNVQNRLKAVHNLDAPWLPADLEQRVGRALRQGNQYGEIEVYGYGTEGSYDSTMWGMLETKAKAIIQFLKGDTDLNSMRDIEETDHFRMAKAMTSGDPRVLKQAELESEVEKLTRQASNFRNEQVQIKSSIASKKSSIESSKQDIIDIEDAKKKLKEPPEGEFLMTVMGTPYTERADASAAFEAAVVNIIQTNFDTTAAGKKIGELDGFDINMFVGNNSNLGYSYEVYLNHPAFKHEGKEWQSGAGTFSASGTITTLTNSIRRLDKRKTGAEASIEANQRDIKVLESNITGEFKKQKELSEKRDELAAVEKDLRENAPVEVVYDDYPVSYWEQNKADMNAKFSIVGDDEFHYRAQKPAKKSGEKLTDKEKVEAKINAHLKKVGFADANVVVVENMEGMNPDASGAYDPQTDLIYVSMTAPDVLGVLNHELIHALRRAGAFTEQEWNTLQSKVKEWRGKYNIDELYKNYSLSEEALNEEAIAAAMQDYTQQGPVRRIINKIVRFMNGIRQAMAGSDYTSPEQVFDDITSGKIAPRVSKKQNIERQENNNVNTQEFKRWFADSKVVDANGKPLVVYHGTRGDINAFDVARLGENTKAASAKQGFFFASSAQVASSYAEIDSVGFDDTAWFKAIDKATKGLAIKISDKVMTSLGYDIVPETDTPNVLPVYLSINNPMTVDFKNQKYREKTYNDIIKEAKSAGHDGVILRNTFDPGRASQGQEKTDVFVAFTPEQIKSVHNRGTFDPKSTDILFSLSKDKKEALKEANEQLSRIKGMESDFRPSLGRISSYILHPHQIASLYKSFTPVYMEAIKMMKSRDVIVHNLSNNIDLYNKLKKEPKSRVNAVLELGRMARDNFVPENGVIVVENPGLTETHHSKPGQKITLRGAEVDAYLGVRKAMNDALEIYMETILQEYGFIDRGIKSREELAVAIKTESDPKEIQRMQEVLKMLTEIENQQRTGYIPFKRWGDVGVTVRRKPDEENEEDQLIRFERIEVPKNTKLRKRVIGENKAVRERVAELSKQFPEDKYDIVVFEVKDFTSLQANLKLNELDVLAASSDMSMEDYEFLRGMLEDAMKRRGFRSHFFKADDVAGYSPDFERAINDYIVSISGHLSRRKFMPKIEKAIGEIEKSGEASLFDYARSYASYITDPKEEFGAVRQMAFMWYLAGNLASGVTNLMQTPMVTAPWLKAMFGHSEIAKQMSAAYKDAVSMMDLQSGTDVFNFDKAPDDVRVALKKAEAEGDFIPLNTFDAMAIANTNVAYLRGLDRTARNVMDAIGITFSVPERLNRVTTYITAYRFAMEPGNRKKIMQFVNRDQIGRKALEGKSGAAFAEAFADYAVFSTQFRMGKLNRPSLARGVGTLPFQFMSFSMQAFELMYRLGKVHGGQKATSIFLMLMFVIAMAGVKGFPFEEDVQTLIEALYKTLTRTDLDIDSEVRKALSKAVGPTAAEAIIKGVPAAVLNVDMSGRLGFGNIIPDGQDDLYGVWFDMLIMKPGQTAIDIARGNYAQAAANISPAFIRNPLQAYSWAEGGIRSNRTGDPIIVKEEVLPSDIFLKALGFTSGNVARERDLVYAEQRASRAVDDLRADYYDRLARAYVARMALAKSDPEAAASYSDQIEAIMSEIGRRNEGAPKHKQILINNKTLKQRIIKEKRGSSANRIRKQARGEVKELGEAYGK